MPHSCLLYRLSAIRRQHCLSIDLGDSILSFAYVFVPLDSRPRKKAATKSADKVLDAIGLARPVGFKDFPGAVSVMCEAKTLPKRDRLDWQPTSPRQFMAVWEAEELIGEFRRTHAGIEQRYKLADKSLIELMASYSDKRPDHRVVCQARER